MLARTRFALLLAALAGLALTAPAHADDFAATTTTHRRALRARRRHRHHLAHPGAGDAEAARRHGHRREQAGRRHHRRHRIRRQGASRRPHAGDGHIRACGEPEPARQTALRHRQGFRAGGAGRALVQHRRRQSQFRHQFDRRPDRRGEGEARRAQLRHLRPRHLGASRRRIVQEPGAREADGRALQGRGAGDH